MKGTFSEVAKARMVELSPERGWPTPGQPNWTDDAEQAYFRQLVETSIVQARTEDLWVVERRHIDKAEALVEAPIK